jgi:hypothetical protein
VKPRIVKRAGGWRQVGPDGTTYAASTISLLSATVKRHREHPWFRDDLGGGA